MESKDKYTNMVLKYEIKDKLEELEVYIQDLMKREYVSFKDPEEINAFFKENIDKIYSTFSQDDIDNMRYYTGTAFRKVNAILRNNWSYELNGVLTEEKQIEYRKLATDINSVISSKCVDIPNNICVYRGVDINAFKRFGVSSLIELTNLVGQYVYDSGFVSTSLLRGNSFFDRPLEYHEKCDIEICYLVPQECSDGIPLITSGLSYNNEQQTEFLLNSSNLSKVIDVKFNSDRTKAYITMVYIPRIVWDKNYVKYLESISLS